MSRLILAGHALDGDLSQLVTMRDDPAWDASKECLWPSSPGCAPHGATSPEAKNPHPQRYGHRPALKRFYRSGTQPPLDVARASIDKFVLHHDGCRDAAMCWRVLHNERGLSCHFLIDGDGTIYQTLDLALMAFHAAQFNVSAIGVELNNRGDARKEPHYYSDRRTVACKIGESPILAWDYTDAQYESMHELARLLVRHLPNLPLAFPQDPRTPGKQLWGVMAPGAGGDSTAVPGYAGYLGHYHCTRRKWDPGAFDFKRFIEKLKRTRVFPLWPGTPPADPAARPDIPAEPAALEQLADTYYQANERDAHGGFYPIGPWGAHRLWHGGVHVPAAPGSGVFAPFAGRVVAARTGVTTPVGSGNFVLTRHDLNLGGNNLRFWLLAMHLADEAPGKDAPSWLNGPSWAAGRVIDGVHVLDEPVDAGALLGRVGVAGPPDAAQAQVHLEIVSIANLFPDHPDEWTVYDGTAGGRFCDIAELTDLVDGDRDGRLSNAELTDFYADPAASAPMHKVVSYNVSEWTEDPDWATSLAAANAAHDDFRRRSRKRKGKRADADADDEDVDLAAMVADQLTPFLWWTADVAAALGLPSDGVVCHYHPIRFIEWVNARLQLGATADAPLDPADTRVIDTRVLQGDIDDVAGDSAYVDLAAPDPDDGRIEVDQLRGGYAGEDALFGTRP